MKLRTIVVPLAAATAVFSTMAFVASDIFSSDPNGATGEQLEGLDLTPGSYLAYVAVENGSQPGEGRR